MTLKWKGKVQRSTALKKSAMPAGTPLRHQKPDPTAIKHKAVGSKKEKENRKVHQGSDCCKNIPKKRVPVPSKQKTELIVERLKRLIRGDARALPSPIVAAEKGAFPTAKVKRRPAVDTLPVVLPTVAAVDAARFHRYTWKKARRFSSTAGRSCSAIRMEMSTSEVVISRMSPVCSLTRRKAWAATPGRVRISSP